MSNRELPMMPWYPDQFAASTSTWSYAERSAYRGLLDVQWALGVLPNEPWRLAQALGMPLEDFEAAWPTVSQKFQSVAGGLRNARLEEHRLQALELHKKKVGAARVRWDAYAEHMRLHMQSTTPADAMSADAVHMPLSPSLKNKKKTLPPYPPSRKRPANGQGGRGPPERSDPGAIREDDPEVQRKRREAETLAAQHAKGRDDDDNGGGGMPF